MARVAVSRRRGVHSYFRKQTLSYERPFLSEDALDTGENCNFLHNGTIAALFTAKFTYLCDTPEGIVCSKIPAPRA